MFDFLYWLYVLAWLWVAQWSGKRPVSALEYRQAMEDHHGH